MPDTDTNMTDHDLLIKLDTKISALDMKIDAIAPVIASLDRRMNEIEESSARHSERLTRLRGDVDALKMDKLNKAEIEHIKRDVEFLRNKSDIWDLVNSVGLAIVTIIGFMKR